MCLGEGEGFILHFLGNSISLRETKGRTWRQELKVEAMRNADFWLILYGFLSLFCFLFWFFITHRTTGLGIALTTVVWVLPHQSLTQKMPYRYTYRPI